MFKKLVRDKIPKIILEKTGQLANAYQAEQEEYEARLLDKMIEELEEFREDPCIEEAADIFEVFTSIINHWNLCLIDVQETAIRKAHSRGGFKDKWILELPTNVENDWDCTNSGELKN